MLHLVMRNDSTRKGICRKDELLKLAERICAGERYARPAEISVLLCDDLFITELNRTYRKKNEPTDVLSFGQLSDGVPLPEHYYVLGDIVISMETVEKRCNAEKPAMKEELRLLFCHGLLHLLGWQHGTDTECKRMAAKQAEYLDIPIEAAWGERKKTSTRPRTPSNDTACPQPNPKTRKKTDG